MTLKDLKKEFEKEFITNVFGFPKAEKVWKFIEKAYRKGKRKGYSKGWRVGNKNGWKRGLKEGQKEGFNEGFARGYKEACRDCVNSTDCEECKEELKIVELIRKEKEPKHCPCCMIGTCKGVK